MSVIVPPKIVANDNGIKNFEGAKSYFSHHDFTMGVRVATIGVLFKKAENKATGVNNFNRATRGFFPSFNNFIIVSSNTPLFWTALAKIKRRAIVSIPSLEK